MSKNPDIASLISAAVAAKMTPEFIEEQIGKRTERLVQDAIDNAFRSYSETGKLVEAALKEALKIDRLDIPSYGATVTTMLKAQIEAIVAPLVAGRLKSDMEELLKLAPATIKLSEIAEKMIERGNHGQEYGPAITVHVDRNEYGSSWVYLDEDNHHEWANRRRATVNLLVSRDGTVSSASFYGRDLNTTQHIGVSYGLEQRVRSWVACGTVLVLDEDAVVTGVGDY